MQAHHHWNLFITSIRTSTMSDTALTTEVLPATPSAADHEAEIKEAADRALRQLSERWHEVAANASSYVKEHPGKAVLAGLGVGFAIGMMFRRD
jgi:ElaB/YqjD/DUF883 family membrane-anchored ribosome-binding protein